MRRKPNCSKTNSVSLDNLFRTLWRRTRLKFLELRVLGRTQFIQLTSPANQTNQPNIMANTILSGLVTEVTDFTTVAKSATALINGFAARQQAAIEEALANGATADELAPLIELQAAVVTERTALSDAVTANTPAA